MKELDEKGFVFIGKNGKPYLCRMYYDHPWFMFWNDGESTWVTLKEVNQNEIWQARETMMPQEEADLYHKKQSEKNSNWITDNLDILFPKD